MGLDRDKLRDVVYKSRAASNTGARSGGDVAFWQRWLRQPQRVWLRRASFQIHLWIGLALGLYIVMLSVTGSVLVYRNELDRFFATPRPTFDAKPDG